MQAIDVGIAVLVLYGLLSGLTALYNHESTMRLARTPAAALELKLHAARSAIYGLLFAGLAWYEWHGVFVWLLVALVAAQLVLLLADSFIEERTRDVTVRHRALHLLHGVVTGAWAGFVFHTAFNDWLPRVTALAGTGYGRISWLLSLFAVLAAIAALRDARAARELERQARFMPPHRLRTRPVLVRE